MQTYKYSAISRAGRPVNGVVEAVDEYAAVAKIRETCTTITKIQAVKEKSTSTTGMELFQPHIKEKDLAVMCSQFSIILGAGLPVVRAIELIADQTVDKNLKKALVQTAEDVGSGISLARAFERRGTLLPIALIESVRAGEETGTLEASFARLQRYYNKTAHTKGKVRAAMTYPVFTLIVAAIVVAVLMVKAVPAFITAFTEMNIELPLPTVILINTSNFFTQYWLVMLMMIACAVLLWALWGHSETGAMSQSRLRLRIPVLGHLNQLRMCAQFASTMSTLLAAGVPMISALDSTSNVLDNATMFKALQEQLPKLEEGKTLASCLYNCPFLPPLLIEMAGIGEQTGTLEHTLEVIGDYYDNEAELASQKVLSMLEPIIICVLAGIVVMILLSVYMPMFSLYDAL